MIRLWLFLSLIVLASNVGAQSIDFQPPPKSGNPKLSSELRQLADVSGIRGKVVASSSEGLLQEDGRAVVVLVPEPGELSSTIDKEALVELGGEILTESRFLIKAILPPSALEQATRIEGVRYLREPIRPQSMAFVTEGVAKIGVSLSHSQEVRGQGVRIAVIDVGFEDSYLTQLLGELPAHASLDFSASAFYEAGSGDHGTACAEIVYDLAPAAELFLLRVKDDIADLALAVMWCVANDVDVISHSLGWFPWGIGDGKGPAAYLVDYAADNGILFVDAAGNKAAGEIHNGTWSDADADGWHNFAQGVEVIELDQVAAWDLINVHLTWDDWSEGFNTTESANDYDLHLVRSDVYGNWSTVKSSINWQPFYSEPTEKVTYIAPSAGTYGIAIKKWSSAAPKSFRILITDNTHKFALYSSSTATIVPPSDAAGAVSVAAINHLAWSTPQIEPFSARGPTFDGRIKPDLAAPDGVSTLSFGFRDFGGTSAAAPHIAGAAALIKSVNPGYSRDQLANALFSAAVDLDPAGKDNTYGYGKLVLPQPATQLVITQQPTTSVNGSQLSTVQITARNDAGQTDANFNETLIISLASGNGVLSGTLSAGAVNGVASFSGVVYTASQDGESYALGVDDDAGTGSNLSSVQSTTISADVVATQLAFAQQPGGSVSGQAFATQPIVQARDASGTLDRDFAESVTLTPSSPGSLSNNTVSAIAGVATFSSVAYTASADGESFSITADDQSDAGTDLPAITSSQVASDVVATRLVFAQEPSGSVSGVALSTQPIVRAQDANGILDRDFAEVITLTESGPGVLSNATQIAIAGVATFSGVIYNASADGDSFSITADDQAGVGTDLPPVSSAAMASDVVATQLVFSQAPPRSPILPT